MLDRSCAAAQRRRPARVVLPAHRRLNGRPRPREGRPRGGRRGRRLPAPAAGPAALGPTFTLSLTRALLDSGGAAAPLTRRAPRAQLRPLPGVGHGLDARLGHGDRSRSPSPCSTSAAPPISGSCCSPARSRSSSSSCSAASSPTGCRAARSSSAATSSRERRRSSPRCSSSPARRTSGTSRCCRRCSASPLPSPGPRRSGIVKEAVSEERLQEGNALLALSRSILSIAAPAIGALIVDRSAPRPWRSRSTAATFFVSAALIASMHLAPTVRMASASILGDLHDGWHEFTRALVGRRDGRSRSASSSSPTSRRCSCSGRSSRRRSSVAQAPGAPILAVESAGAVVGGDLRAADQGRPAARRLPAAGSLPAGLLLVVARRPALAAR